MPELPELPELPERETREDSPSPETDAEKTERQRKARSLRTWTDDEGMGCGSWRLPPAAQARLLAQLDSARSEIFLV